MSPPHGEPLLPHASAETLPRVVQKRQVSISAARVKGRVFPCLCFDVFPAPFRYFPLLAKQKPDHPECDVLLNVFNLLLAKNASPATVAMVMDMTESLATAEDFVATEMEAEVVVSGCVFPQPEGGAAAASGSHSNIRFVIVPAAGRRYIYKSAPPPPEPLTQGSRLLLPHISTLLRYFSGVVCNTSRLKKKKFKAQVAKELNILSK